VLGSLAVEDMGPIYVEPPKEATEDQIGRLRQLLEGADLEVSALDMGILREAAGGLIGSGGQGESGQEAGNWLPSVEVIVTPGTHAEFEKTCEVTKVWLVETYLPPAAVVWGGNHYPVVGRS
jgi:hypothetical protein